MYVCVAMYDNYGEGSQDITKSDYIMLIISSRKLSWFSMTSYIATMILKRLIGSAKYRVLNR